jgi:hypothetical protein
MTSEARESNEERAPQPEPEPENRPIEEVDGESVAVPAGDLTGAITHAIEDAIERDDS